MTQWPVHCLVGWQDGKALDAAGSDMHACGVND